MKISTDSILETESPLCLLKKQRSHVLLVQSNAKPGCDLSFRDWYRGSYLQAVTAHAGVLNGLSYEQHEVDITRGSFPRPPYRYLGVFDLSLDGAQEADSIIQLVVRLHAEQADAHAPATWLYYPISGKVGASQDAHEMLIVAFANGLPGQEMEFREWYATRHIRHALQISTIVSGQCFERTQYQPASGLEASYGIVAMYEHSGAPEEFLCAHAAVPRGALRFPSLDLHPSRFAEWLYCRI